jgi:hypothetical protein
MDNITPLVPDTKSSCIITLDPLQYACYQQNCIELQSPDGKFLELVGHAVQKDVEESNFCRLREQVFLLQALCNKIDQEVEFPPQAIVGLADIFLRMQKHM